LLEGEGYEVATAENGFDALLKLKQSLPDVIISDLNMPKMSGFEFLSAANRKEEDLCGFAQSIREKLHSPTLNLNCWSYNAPQHYKIFPSNF
jgi:CheY-like chemotaxis protein